MNNLHFVLHKVPNDHSALALLVQWDKAGGRDKDYASPACYLTWAKQFAPNDPMVWTYGGYYFYQKNDPVLAGQWWEEALVLDPANAEANYNLGLLMFGQGRYPEARQHAHGSLCGWLPAPGLA